MRIRRILKWVGAILLLAAVGLGSYVLWQAHAFNTSMAKVYDVPLVEVSHSTDPAVIERGKHLAFALGECTACHGENLGGGREEKFGPLGRIVYPNVTTGKGGRLSGYSDAELARLIKHGIKRDGHTVVMMPSENMAWWPMEDVVAVISYLRTVAPVDGNPGVIELGILAKVLDRRDSIPLDVARRIDHDNLPTAPEPAPDARYGAFIATSCRGCHGANLSGGPIPGAPPDLPVPRNLTMHDTGLKGWTYDDFHKAIQEGQRKDGKKMDPFMPVEALRNFDDIELRALWAYLASIPPRPFGDR